MEKSVIGKDEFREKGYLYDSMENYSDLIPYIKLMKSYMMVSKLEALDLMNQED